MTMKIETPQDLVAALVELFPSFADEWDNGEAYGHSGDYSFCTVFMELAPVCAGLLAKATPRALKSFCALVDDFVSN
jgi:hypothetical protein